MDAVTSDTVIGRLVDGRYEVVRRIARGGMASVYQAVDRRLDREVAVKIMHAHLAESEDFVARFRREARAAARLSHPHVVAVYDQGLWEDSFYLTMEFVEGEDLRERLRREGTLPLGEALAITENVLDALAAAHRNSLVHRDIKPENVMIDTEGVVKVADFGLARAISDATAASSGTVLGTVAYLAPELVTHGEASAASDVYAAGILLYEMITGSQPFSGDLPINVAMSHVNEDVPPPSATAEWVPREVDDLLAALTARDRSERLQDGAAALVLLRRLRDGLDQATLARRVTPAPGAGDVPDDDGQYTVPLDRKLSSGTVALPVGGIRQADAAPPPPRRRGRRVVLTILLLLLASAGAVAGWYFLLGPGAFTTLPDVAGHSSDEAVATLQEAGFDPVVSPRNDDVVPADVVIETNPAGNSDVRRGASVDVVVSLGVLMVTMPEVAGIGSSDAVAALTTEGFPDPEVTEAYHETVPEGTVISATTPDGAPVEPGTEYDHRTVVSLTVSLGREPVETPEVVGMSQQDAEAALTDAGLTVQYGQAERSRSVDEGVVIRQSPAAGDEFQLYRGDTVTLVLSLGPPLVEVPDLLRMSSAEAESALTALGLVPDPDFLWEGILDTVRFQDPGAGTMVPEGSTVSYRVL